MLFKRLLETFDHPLPTSQDRAEAGATYRLPQTLRVLPSGSVVGDGGVVCVWVFCGRNHRTKEP